MILIIYYNHAIGKRDCDIIIAIELRFDIRLNLKRRDCVNTIYHSIFCLSNFFVTNMPSQLRVERAVVNAMDRGYTATGGYSGDRWASRRLTEETAFSLLPFCSFCPPSPCPLWPPFLSSWRAPCESGHLPPSSHPRSPTLHLSCARERREWW